MFILRRIPEGLSYRLDSFTILGWVGRHRTMQPEKTWLPVIMWCMYVVRCGRQNSVYVSTFLIILIRLKLRHSLFNTEEHLDSSYQGQNTKRRCKSANKKPMYRAKFKRKYNCASTCLHTLEPTEYVSCMPTQNQRQNERPHQRLITVGSLNANILRYNADIISATLKLWGKLDENVSWVNTFPSLSPISLHFIR